MEHIIQEIIKTKKSCYFISPHLDDAILSAGGLLASLSDKTKVTVINIFTQSSEQNTLSAKLAIKRAGFDDSQTYYEKRREEDHRVMMELGIDVINLGFVDALWRPNKKLNIVRNTLGKFIPELSALYPTYRYHVEKGKIASQDVILMGEILQKLVFIEKDAIVFCPVGIGGHVDHLITAKVCKKLTQRVIFWSDFPYNQDNKKTTSNMKPILSSRGVNLKAKYIRKYKTQVSQMFPEGKIPEMEEIFYV